MRVYLRRLSFLTESQDESEALRHFLIVTGGKMFVLKSLVQKDIKPTDMAR